MTRLSGSVKLLCACLSGSPYARLYGRPPFGFRPCPGLRPRPAAPLPDAPSLPESPPSGPLAAATPPATRRPEPPRPGARPPPRQSPPPAATATRSHLPAPFLRLQPTVAHRLALARIRPHLRPVDRQLPQLRQTQCPRQSDHLDKQLLEIRQVPLPKRAHRPVVREIVRRQKPERDVLFQLLGYPPRGKYTRRIRVEQNLHQHPRLIRCIAPTVPRIPRVEGRQIQTVHQIADVVRQVPRRQPFPYIPVATTATAPARSRERSSTSTNPFLDRSSTILPSRFLRRRLLALDPGHPQPAIAGSTKSATERRYSAAVLGLQWTGDIVLQKPLAEIGHNGFRLASGFRLPGSMPLFAAARMSSAFARASSGASGPCGPRVNQRSFPSTRVWTT